MRTAVETEKVAVETEEVAVGTEKVAVGTAEAVVRAGVVEKALIVGWSKVAPLVLPQVVRLELACMLSQVLIQGLLHKLIQVLVLQEVRAL